MKTINLAYQIEKHAHSLRRWFSPEEATAWATRSVMAGNCWWWPEPPEPPEPWKQMRLFD